MSSKQNFELLLMIGIVKSLRKRDLITEYELLECIKKIEREEANVESSGILQGFDR